MQGETLLVHKRLMAVASTMPDEPRLVDENEWFDVHVDSLLSTCTRAYRGPGKWDEMSQAELGQETATVANALWDSAATLRGSPADDSVLEILPGNPLETWLDLARLEGIARLSPGRFMSQATKTSLVLESIAANVEACYAAYETLRVYPNKPTHRRFCARLLYQHMRKNYQQPLHATVALLTGVLLRDSGVTIDMVRPAWTSLIKKKV